MDVRQLFANRLLGSGQTPGGVGWYLLTAPQKSSKFLPGPGTNTPAKGLTRDYRYTRGKPVESPARQWGG